MRNSGTQRLIWLVAALAIGATMPATMAVAQSDTTQTEAAAEPAKAKKKRDPGETLYLRRTCIACHGRGGAGAIQDYPNLAGQNENYMLRQIKDILDGKRKGSPDATGNPRSEGMRGALVNEAGERRITDDEIKAVVSWLAQQKPSAPIAAETPIDPARLEQGAKDYEKAKCKTCHGPDGRKPKAKTYPYIAGQKAAYIVAQLTDMRDGHRDSGQSKLMKAFVKKLDDDTIGRIADYLSQIDRNQP